MNLLEQQAANRRRTWLVMAGFVLLLVVIGGSLDGVFMGNGVSAVPFMTIFALAIGGGQAWWGLRHGSRPPGPHGKVVHRAPGRPSALGRQSLPSAGRAPRSPESPRVTVPCARPGPRSSGPVPSPRARAGRRSETAGEKLAVYVWCSVRAGGGTITGGRWRAGSGGRRRSGSRASPVRPLVTRPAS